MAKQYLFYYFQIISYVTTQLLLLNCSVITDSLKPNSVNQWGAGRQRKTYLEENTRVRMFSFHRTDADEIELSRVIIWQHVDLGVWSIQAFLPRGDLVMCSEVTEGVVSRFEAVWTAEAFLYERSMLGHGYKSVLVWHHLYDWRVDVLDVQQTTCNEMTKVKQLKQDMKDTISKFYNLNCKKFIFKKLFINIQLSCTTRNCPHHQRHPRL